MKVVIGGATGFLGRALIDECSNDGHEVVSLVRGDVTLPGSRSVQWDGRTVGEWANEIDGADVVVNMAGAPITLKWTEENKRLIRNSRVESTLAIRSAIESAKKPPRVFLSGSAVGFYGDTGDKEATEGSAPGNGFMPDLCVEWEDAARTSVTRVVHLRTGVVLGKEAGMFPVMEKLAKAFVGGAVGDGKQYIPWIHLEDYVRLLRYCGLSDITGPVNLCAPEPVTNAEFMDTLRKVLGRPWAPPAPKLAVKALGALGGPDPTLALVSSRVVPKVALDRGFTYKWPDLYEAIRDLAA